MVTVKNSPYTFEMIYTDGQQVSSSLAIVTMELVQECFTKHWLLDVLECRNKDPLVM